MARSPEKTVLKPEAIDRIARLTADLDARGLEGVGRLREILVASAASGDESALGPVPEALAAIEVEPERRDLLALVRPGRKDLNDPPLHVMRRDLQADLVAGRLADALTGLRGGERLGPFVVDDRPVIFEYWREARRVEIAEAGAAAPAFVLGSARRPRISFGPTTSLDLQKGVVWIRGDLLAAGLPAGAYVGVSVSDGSVTLPAVTASTDDAITIPAPISAVIELVLDAEEIAPAPGGCAAGVKLALPTLTLTFTQGALDIRASAGAATAWGQDFAFGDLTGVRTFVPQLWTLLLGCKTDADRFDAGLIGSAIADFAGEAAIAAAALALPVVVAAPAALGAAAQPPGYWLALEGMMARWYAPDARDHVLDPWLAITNRSAALLDVDVAALAEPVRGDYRLWELAGTEGRRLRWRHDYTAPFMVYYVCDVETGEQLLATGAATVALDRPVQANGGPVPTPTTNGVLLLRGTAEGPRVMLGAAVTPGPGVRLVLRNALVWATHGVTLIAEGTLAERRRVDAGSLSLRFGVYSWTPTLPDPYVGNFHACGPFSDVPRAVIAAVVRWTDPAAPELSFAGDIGLPVVCADRPSSGEPRPAPRADLSPDVGLTQTEQGATHPDEGEIKMRKTAQAREERERQGRAARAEKMNAEARATLDGQMAERLGRTPPVFLLDVSTNQDMLGVALWGVAARGEIPGVTAAATSPAGGGFPVQALDVTAPVGALRLVTLPQIQWEPVRTLDEDQDVITLGWFPTPLASASDGGPTVLGARSEKLAPVIPAPLLDATKAVFDDGGHVVFRTTLPFGLVAVVSVNPQGAGDRKPDSYEITRPDFPDEAATGGLQITAEAESGHETASGISPFFAGATRQLINGVDLATGAPLGLSVLSSAGDPGGDVESIFNNDMSANPKVPVTRFDLSGYGGSNFSKWENPYAVFAETAKTQFQVTVGRTALEIIKVASVLHPWGIKVTRSVIVERRSGGGVIRRDTGWQATSPGLLDYRYANPGIPGPDPMVADYPFDSGIFRGLFDVRGIRPAPGIAFSNDGATFVPYYFDAELALDGLAGRTPANGVLGWLQTEPNGVPASRNSLRALLRAQGAAGGPVDAWIDFGASRLPFRAQRIEMEVVDDGAAPLFVATVRGVPKLPTTGAWSVARRPVAVVPPDGGEAAPVSESRGVPIVRRHAVLYPADDDRAFAEPPRDTTVPLGDWMMADPADLLAPAAPQNEYCLLQSTPTHAFLYPRPYARAGSAGRVLSDAPPELAVVIARATSKGAFPPPANAIRLAAPMPLEVGPGGSLALPGVVSVVDHPTPLRIAGENGHGSLLSYQGSTLELELTPDKWRAEFTGLTMWSDIAGLVGASGARLRIVGSTDQRPQVAEIETLVYQPVEQILSYLPVFGARDKLGPIDLGASNAKHEIKIDIATIQEVPKNGFSIAGGSIKLLLGAGGSTGFDMATGGVKASGQLTAGAKGEFPFLSVGVASAYIVVQLDVTFSITSVVGVVKSESLELVAFAGVGVKGEIGPFKAYAYLGIGFVFVYDFVADVAKFGGLVRFEAGVDLTIVKVKLLAELKGVVYKAIPSGGTTEKTLCDYAGKVKLQVDIFLIISISATYSVSDTTALD